MLMRQVLPAWLGIPGESPSPAAQGRVSVPQADNLRAGDQSQLCSA